MEAIVPAVVAATFPEVAGAIAVAEAGMVAGATADGENWSQVPGVRCQEPGASKPSREFGPVILSGAKDPCS